MAVYQAKTKVEDQPLSEFLDAVAPPDRQAEARVLVPLFSEVTGYAPKLYTGGMVGFGRYAYTYASGHSGTSFVTGFAPRKAELSIYLAPGFVQVTPILSRLGKHRIGKGCLYLRHLSDADPAVLRELIAAGLADLRTRWTVFAE
jgi:hypothetical protein